MGNLFSSHIHSVVRVALIGLEEYTKGKKYLDLQLEPQEQYVREQVILSLKEVGDLLRKERLKFEDIRESIENLFALLEHLFSIKAFKAALVSRPPSMDQPRLFILAHSDVQPKIY